MDVDSLDDQQFNEDFDGDFNGIMDGKSFENKIHLWIQKRNGKKSITSVEGLIPYQESGVLVIERFLKSCKKRFCCNGNLAEKGVVCLQGDHRQTIVDLLTIRYGIKKDEIIVHGY